MKKSTFLGLNKKQQLTALRMITHIGALLPLALLYADYYTYNLGADEIRAAILRTGKPALVLLVLSLTVTPLAVVTGWNIIRPLRKPLGLYAFLYVTIHFSIFAVIDYGLELRTVWEEIVLRRYALVGFAAFLILIPLALTSTKWAQRKMGKNWKKLHRLVYLAAVLAIIHYIWLVKGDLGDPLLYGGILLILLGLRLDPIRKRVSAWRKRLVVRSA